MPRHRMGLRQTALEYFWTRWKSGKSFSVTALEFEHIIRWHTRVSMSPYQGSGILEIDVHRRPPGNQTNALSYKLNDSWFEKFTGQTAFVLRSSQSLREWERNRQRHKKVAMASILPTASTLERLADATERIAVALEKLAEK